MKKKYFLSGSEDDDSTRRIYLTYGECQKNQSEHIGGHVFDGCQAFWPLGEEGTPNAFICVACFCHRSYHEIEVHNEPARSKAPPPPPPPSTPTQGPNGGSVNNPA